MSPPERGQSSDQPGWVMPSVVFLAVGAMQLWLVAVAGTDVPFHDQWGIEGAWLYPAWQEGSLRADDFLQPFNEHRIFWTHLLNLGLFVAICQWDPLVQMVAIALLRSVFVAGLAWRVGAGYGWKGQGIVGVVLIFAFLPHLAWHTVLWGIQSHTYFVLGFSMFAMGLLGRRDRTPSETVGGLAAGLAALVAMGPGALVPGALLGLATVMALEARRLDRATWQLAWPALVLLVMALGLRPSVPEHGGLGSASWSEFLFAAGQMLGWPHVGQLFAALVMNFPLVLLVAGRVLRRRQAAERENFVVLVAGWSVGVALATAWVRGGSAELAVGVPSRYVDFMVLLSLANGWCAFQLAHESAHHLRSVVRLVAGAWGAFALAGWLGLSAEVMRGLVLPRARDRETPVQLIQEFQRTNDPAVFIGQPRLYVPHPNIAAMSSVLNDPRLEGSLPPSLQPEQPMGAPSAIVRKLLGR